MAEDKEVKRLNYFKGQFLQEEDFNAEQAYHIRMRRLHNRALHTWGVVEGLAVSQVVSQGSSTNSVVVAPGIAIDNLGQEIVLPIPGSSSIAITGVTKGDVFITVSYGEVDDPLDKYATAGVEGKFKKKTERPLFRADAAAPAAGSVAVLLAKVSVDGGNVTAISNEVRRLASSALFSSSDLEVRSLKWGNNSRLLTDHGGSIELGGDSNTAGTGTPYIDFHFGPKAAEDFNVRLINDADGKLSIQGKVLQITGNVGIGTVSPTKKLTVSTTATSPDGVLIAGSDNHSVLTAPSLGQGSFNRITSAGDAGIIYSGGSINTGAFVIAPWADAASGLRIDANGNVGIGVTTPGRKLVVDGNSTILAGIANWGEGLRIIARGSDTYAGTLYGRADEDAKALWFTGIGAFADNNRESDLIFLSGPGRAGTSDTLGFTSSSFEKPYRKDAVMVLEHSTGNAFFGASLGIGTPTPGAKLTVQHGSTPNVSAANGKGLFVSAHMGTGAASDGGIEFRHDNLTQGIGFGYNTIYATGSNANQDLALQSRGTGSVLLNPTSGNVGIGTPTPAVALDVVGDIKATGKITGDGSGLTGVKIQGGGIVNNAFVGDVGHGPLWAGFAHSNSATQTGYGFLHHNTGQFALINKKSGGGFIGLRIDNVDKMVLDDKGNVGIGTAAPGAKLHLLLPATPAVLRIQATPSGFGAGRIEFWSDPQGSANEWRPGSIQSTDNGGFTGGLAFLINGSGPTAKTSEVEVMRIVNSNVGIGTTEPKATLDINGAAFLGYEKTVSEVTTPADFGVPLKSGFYQNGGAKIVGDVPDPSHSWTHLITARHSNTANNHQLQIAASYATNDRLYFRKIAAAGTANPAWTELATRGANIFSGNQMVNGTPGGVPLEVKGFNTILLNRSPDGFSFDGGFNVGFGLGTPGGGNFNVSILAEHWVAGAGIVANSDRRIKQIVGSSDTAKDLEIIQNLRVTDYRPLDKMAEGDSLRRGFIGQEVLEVLPQAVARRTNVIPDIYCKAADFTFDQKQKTLSITLPGAHELTKGQVVQILTEDASKTVTVAAVPTPSSFVVGEFEKAPMQVFVYGRQVDDFLSVHYDQIFSTGIGAIQELNKIVASKDARIASFERELATLKQHIAANADVKALQDVNAAARRLLAEQDKRLAKLEARGKTRNGNRAPGVNTL